MELEKRANASDPCCVLTSNHHYAAIVAPPAFHFPSLFALGCLHPCRLRCLGQRRRLGDSKCPSARGGGTRVRELAPLTNFD